VDQDLTQLFKPPATPVANELALLGNEVFLGSNGGGVQALEDLIRNPEVSQITINTFDEIFYKDRTGSKKALGIFASSIDYINWLNRLLSRISPKLVPSPNNPNDYLGTIKADFFEGSFDPTLNTDIRGSIHLATKNTTHGDPALTVRKQPPTALTLEELARGGMLSYEMADFLNQAMAGRTNILVSGGSGAGKTTLVRALSYLVDPSQRLLTVEEIDELYVRDRLPNAVSMFTTVVRDANGSIVRETTAEDLVREALRMRADRIWVGETRGREAYALIKACNSGHDGSITTMHADDSRQALDQVATYVMETGLNETVALKQVVRAFQLVVQINTVSMGRRVITEISQIDGRIEAGGTPSLGKIFEYDITQETWRPGNSPTPSNQLLNHWKRYGVNYVPPVRR
jgi:pilus assembly protein CpaF